MLLVYRLCGQREKVAHRSFSLVCTFGRWSFHSGEKHTRGELTEQSVSIINNTTLRSFLCSLTGFLYFFFLVGIKENWKKKICYCEIVEAFLGSILDLKCHIQIQTMKLVCDIEVFYNN